MVHLGMVVVGGVVTQLAVFDGAVQAPFISAPTSVAINDIWDGNRFVRPDDPEEPRGYQIRTRLAKIDEETIRPLRAMQAGLGSDTDADILRTLEKEAISLRKELSTLGD